VIHWINNSVYSMYSRVDSNSGDLFFSSIMQITSGHLGITATDNKIDPQKKLT
jgi:hypothetical protein